MDDDLHLAALKDRLAAQARELNRVFLRAFADMLRGKTRSFRDIGRALKAQNQCRIALRCSSRSTRQSRHRKNRDLSSEALAKEEIERAN